jgi:hypothetical protein
MAGNACIGNDQCPPVGMIQRPFLPLRTDLLPDMFETGVYQGLVEDLDGGLEPLHWIRVRG